MKGEDYDMEALRLAILAELDAINLYEQLAARTRDKNLREVFRDVAREEKTHVGEFLEMLKLKDQEQVKELAEGREEVEEMMAGK